ncbi:hypothetical protein IAQ67_13965 [Paenibacillus peoriae]|uniref:ApeA N-terminal domain-containing protein n=1 Tax=Paenibacillus peoriae TaxID=59893 RepID=A0A7H0Y1S7_9BACL|nr:hypothetical protein [Paenibacillus peoriae]QNR65035.1 hypothetical protein IAQ67_13965 [Paenibacillus peoriae]
MCSLTFNSILTEEMFKRAVTHLKKYQLNFFFDDGYCFNNDEIDLDNLNESISSQISEDLLVTNELGIGVEIPRSDEYELFSLDGLYEFIQNAEQGKVHNYELFVSPNMILVHVDYQRPRFEELDTIEYTLEQMWKNKKIIITLVEGFTIFSMRLIMERMFDKYTPPVFEEDLFIKIYSENGIDLSDAEEVIQAYIFECGTSLNLNLTPAPRPTSYDFFYADEDDSKQEKNKIRLRSLIQGKGISEVLKIYNSGNDIHNSEFLILTYTKVIEYVSQTVLRKEMLDSVTKKLYSPRALNPDSTFILELEKLYDEHRNYSKDHQAIKLTVQTCCDISDIESIAPKYLKKLSLETLASAISDTRNMIAHAKTNYRYKGQECPVDEMEQFAQCLKVVANQTIRWFARQHEDGRIV